MDHILRWLDIKSRLITLTELERKLHVNSYQNKQPKAQHQTLQTPVKPGAAQHHMVLF